MKKNLNIVIVAIIGGIFSLLTVLLNYILLYHKKRDKLNLKNHSFFVQMKLHRKVRIPQIRIENPLKDKLIKEFLTYKFQVFEVLIRDLVEYCQKAKMENEELHSTFVKIILKGVEDYEHKALELEPSGIFLARFKEWHYGRVTHVCDTAREIINSSFLKTNEQKLVSILNSLLNAFDMTIVDAEKTCNSLNGQLEKALADARKS